MLIHLFPVSFFRMYGTLYGTTLHGEKANLTVLSFCQKQILYAF
jgi:hypothetical protein